MKYKFKIEREYSITESFEREYETDTVDAAQALADVEADESNMDCPDDCSEDESGNSHSSNFEARLVGLSE